MKHLLYIIICAFILSCTNNHIGQKVYLEKWSDGLRLHIDRSCTNNTKSHMMEYIDTTELTKHIKRLPFIPFCQKCVTNEDADHIKAIVERDLNSKVKELYYKLLNDGYKLDDQISFREKLRNDASFRQDLYRTLVDDNYDMEDYSDFEANVGARILSE